MKNSKNIEWKFYNEEEESDNLDIIIKDLSYNEFRYLKYLLETEFDNVKYFFSKLKYEEDSVYIIIKDLSQSEFKYLKYLLEIEFNNNIIVKYEELKK